MSRIRIEDLPDDALRRAENEYNVRGGATIKDGTSSTLFVGKSIGNNRTETIGAAYTVTVGGYQIISAGKDLS